MARLIHTRTFSGAMTAARMRRASDSSPAFSPPLSLTSAALFVSAATYLGSRERARSYAAMASSR